LRGFLDTNVIVRHIVQDHPEHSVKATALFDAIDRDEIVVRTSGSVVFVAVFTLEKSYRVPRADIRRELQGLLNLPGIEWVGQRLIGDVFALYEAHPALSFADCYQAEFARRSEPAVIISFDRASSRVPGLTREEP
jgi:predicted nucleic acid-binding protein